MPIHLVAIAQSNPNHQVIPVKIEDNKNVNWFHVDRVTLTHVKNIFDQIQYDNLLLIEWDVLVNMELPKVEFADVFAKASYEAPAKDSPDREKWWWKEIKKLPEFLQDHAHGIFPASVIGIKKDVLKQVIDPKWDEIFNQEIHCEVRLPTILNYLGYKAKPWPKELGNDHLILDGTQVETIKEIFKNNPETKGVIHPVK